MNIINQTKFTKSPFYEIKRICFGGISIMTHMCKCGNLIYLIGDTGTPENYYHGKCSKCTREVTIRENVRTRSQRVFWKEPVNEDATENN